MIYLFSTIFFLLAILFYFRIADKYNIIDKPNERSSHTDITIRGGGIIFLIAIVTAVILYPQHWLLGLAAFAIGTISFIDDRVTLSSRVRMLVHLFAVTLLFLSINAFALPLYQIFLLYFIAIGVINAYNFMDGINGITGCYSLVVLGGLQWVNSRQVPFIQADLIWLPILSCLVFLFFNFRKKAKCFAGDVGSVTIAFWIIMLVLKLILFTGNWAYMLFLAVYGVDATLTIIHRLILKQNIFEAHRLHVYQLLVNEYKVPHLIVSVAYALIQMLVIFLVSQLDNSSWFIWVLVLLPLALIYLVLKPMLMKHKK